MLNARDVLVRLRKRAFSDVAELSMSDSGLQDVAELRFFTHLEHLNLARNGLQRAHEAACLDRLVSLDLSHNQLSSFLAVPGMPRLESLLLRNNRLICVNLRGCARLRLLDVANNRLSELNGALECPAIERLDCSGNSIADLREIEALGGLPCLRDLRAGGNAAALADAYFQRICAAIPALEVLDGAAVAAVAVVAGAGISAGISAGITGGISAGIGAEYSPAPAQYYSAPAPVSAAAFQEIETRQQIEADAAARLEMQAAGAVEAKMGRLEEQLFEITNLMMQEEQSSQAQQDRIRELEMRFTAAPPAPQQAGNANCGAEPRLLVPLFEHLGASLRDFFGAQNACQFVGFLGENLSAALDWQEVGQLNAELLVSEAKFAAEAPTNVSVEETRISQPWAPVDRPEVQLLQQPEEEPIEAEEELKSVKEHKAEEAAKSEGFAVENSSLTQSNMSPMARTENASVVQLQNEPMRDRKSSSLSAEVWQEGAVYNGNEEENVPQSIVSQGTTLSIQEEMQLPRAGTFVKPPSAEPQFSDIEATSRPASELSVKMEQSAPIVIAQSQIAEEFKPEKNQDAEKSASIPTRISVTESESDAFEQDNRVVKTIDDDDLDDFEGVDLEPDW